MEITYKQVDDIVRTLPIGLYAKRRIPMETSKTEETSYYVPSLDTIVISFPIIQTAVRAINKLSDDELEVAVRSMVYHEVGHAILTPQDMNTKEIYNIFEDERLETLLKDTFLDIDFESQKYAINGFKKGDTLPTPTDKRQEFYHLVRFRSHNNPNMVKMVDAIIQKYKHLHHSSPYLWYGAGSSVPYYEKAIYNLYMACGLPEVKQKKALQDIMSTCNIELPVDNGQEQGQEKAEGGKPSKAGEGESVGNGKPSGASEGEENPFNDIFIKAVNVFKDEKLHQSLDIVFQSFNKKNAKGNALQGYSGVLNPRLADRPDYRMFDRATSSRGANTFGTFHLNLFIDKSGSMYNSELKLNQLVHTLIDLEQRNPNFDFTLILCSRGQEILKDKKDYMIKCNGGNRLTDDIYKQYRSVQKPNTFNYNIVLFDGEAFPSTRSNFNAFDFNNCTIISDYENEHNINGYVKNAKVIYTTDYTNELFDNIIKVMQTAFR